MSQAKPGTKGGPKPAGSGRRAGTPNKTTAKLKELIDGALAELGGQKYLVWAAKAEPAAFLSLLGKTLPKDLNLNGLRDLEVNLVSRQAQN